MTPKQKAQDIYDQMKGIRVKNTHRKSTARKCVKQIIEAFKDFFDEDKLGKPSRETLELGYWKDVLTEIEKL